jgi:hypothetical protein
MDRDKKNDDRDCRDCDRDYGEEHQNGRSPWTSGLSAYQRHPPRVGHAFVSTFGGRNLTRQGESEFRFHRRKAMKNGTSATSLLIDRQRIA